MTPLLETLEERVATATALIAHLRAEVERLQGEQAAGASRQSVENAPEASELPALREEVARLRAERLVVRDRVRALIREIDQVTW